MITLDPKRSYRLSVTKAYSNKAWRAFEKAEVGRLIDDLIDALNHTKAGLRISEEKGRRLGQFLYAPTSINSFLRAQGKKRGWGQQTEFEFCNYVDGDKTETTDKVDFILGKKRLLGVEMALGKYSCGYWDAVGKLPKLVYNQKIHAGVLVAPSKRMIEHMHSSVICAEKAYAEVCAFGKHLTAPILIVSVDAV
jgi:hypothetical protein